MKSKIYEGILYNHEGFVSLRDERFDWLISKLRGDWNEGENVKIKIIVTKEKQENIWDSKPELFIEVAGPIHIHYDYRDCEDYGPYRDEEELSVGDTVIMKAFYPETDWFDNHDEGDYVYIEIEQI